MAKASIPKFKLKNLELIRAEKTLNRLLHNIECLRLQPAAVTASEQWSTTKYLKHGKEETKINFFPTPQLQCTEGEL